MKKSLKRLTAAFATVLLLAMMLCATVSAKDIAGSEAFEEITSGGGRYMGSAYVDNYAFDCEELGFMDTGKEIWLSVSNMLLDIDRYLAYMGLNLIHFAFQLNIAELMGDQLDKIQVTMKDTIFEPLYLFGFIGVAIGLVKKLWYRNASGIVAEVGKVLLILLFVVALGKSTATVLSTATTVSRDLGLSVVMQMNGQAVDGDVENFTVGAVGTLWDDLIHEPWLNLEFRGSDYTEDDVGAILSKTPGSEARQDFINKYIESHPNAFAKGDNGKRVGPLIIYTIVMLIKLLVYIACAVVVLAFQLLAIFYAFMGAVILIMAMFDSLGGIHLITDWLRKMLETQLMILITTMLLGLMIWFGNVMDFANGTLGWMGGMAMQAAVIVVVFVMRRQIFRGFQRMRQNPRSIPQQMLAMSPAGAAGAAYMGMRAERDRQRTIRYQSGALAMQETARENQWRQENLLETQQEIADLELEEKQLRKEQREERARQREETRRQKEEAARDAAERTRAKREEPSSVPRPKTTSHKEQEDDQPARKNADVERPTTAPQKVSEQPEIPAADLQRPDVEPAAGDFAAEQSETPPEESTPRPTTQGGETDMTPEPVRNTPERPTTQERRPAAAVSPRGNPPEEQNTTQSTARPTTAGQPASQNPPRKAAGSPQTAPATGTGKEHAETRRTPPAASQGPIQAEPEGPTAANSVTRPEMTAPPERMESRPAAEQPRNTPSPAAETPSAQTPQSRQSPAAQDKTAQAVETAREAAAAAKAEHKQTEAGRTVSAGVMNYNNRPEEPQSSGERPTISERPKDGESGEDGKGYTGEDVKEGDDKANEKADEKAD